MLDRGPVDKIIPILRKNARRALRMKVAGFPAPYFCSFLLRDAHWFNTSASSGSVVSKKSDQSRSVYCDIRVGSYRSDQVTDGGLNDNDDEVESASLVTVPIDDRCYDGLELGLWKLSEVKYREALSDLNHKEALTISTIDPNKDLASFAKQNPLYHVEYVKQEAVDENRWVRFCKHASSWMSEFPNIFGSWVDFDASQETKIFVSTEDRIIVQHERIFSLTATLRKLTKEGSYLDQELVVNVATQRELPDMREFKELMLKKYEQLMQLSRAKKIHAFSGPVLLYPGPAGLLIHEAIGHRLEGSRLLSRGEGQTFKGQVGKRIINVDLSVRDDPQLSEFNGQRCIGAYQFDDEGTEALNTSLIQNGVLESFLSTRSALQKKGFVPNGHARNKKYQRPISRMAVTVIEGKKTEPLERLKERLLREIRVQNKPFGMIVYETSGGETETTTYDFQAFSGEISYATLVYPDGKEIPIRGVNFVGTPLQALHNIIGIGDTPEVDNGYCGAESGFIPVTKISPAILVKNLELQAKDEELVTPYILPRPRSEKKRKSRKRKG